MSTTRNFPEGYQAYSDKSYMFTEQTPKGMIPQTNSDIATEDTKSANRLDAEQNELIYRGIGAKVSTDMSVNEILDAADLNWEVKKVNTYFDTGSGYKLHEGWSGVARTDTNEILSTRSLAGKHWEVYQNKDAVTTFVDFCKAGGLQLERVGSLSGGKIVFAVAKVNEQFTLPGNDLVTGKLILVCHHAPGKGIPINLMALRRVCTNAMVMPVRTNGITVKHNDKNIIQKVENVLYKAKTNFEEFHQDSELLANTPIDAQQAQIILIDTFGNPKLPLEEQPRVVQTCLNMFNNKLDKGAEMLSAYETAWGLLNSVTAYYNHNSVNSDSAKQIQSLWLSSRAQLERKMFNQLVRVALR